MEYQKEIKQESELLIVDDLDELLQLMNKTSETTISAFEGEFDNVDDFLPEGQILVEILDNFTPINQKVDEFSCQLCNLEFWSTSHLYRHFNSKKHQRLEAALYLKSYNLAASEHDRGQFMHQNDQFNVGGSFYNEAQNFPITFEIKKSPAETRYLHTELYNCRYCSKNFSSSSNARRHENLHNMNNHECYICAKKFKQKEYLKKHIMTHFKADRHEINLITGHKKM